MHMHTTFLDALAVDAQRFGCGPDVGTRRPHGFLHHLPQVPGDGDLLVLVGERGLHVQDVATGFRPSEAGRHAGA